MDPDFHEYQPKQILDQGIVMLILKVKQLFLIYIKCDQVKKLQILLQDNLQADLENTM